MKDVKFSDLVGETLVSVANIGDKAIAFKTVDGTTFKLHHYQDCCESVTVESIVGDLNDLIGTPILVAEEVTSKTNPPDAKPEDIQYQDSFTWTFYKLATIKGYVDIRWYGESNGYYSESVDFVEET
jgi:hypothetical protein